MRKLPSLNALKAFEATARLSSITQAAEELGVSHSSISQQIKQLEYYFGQRLFLRKGRGIEPSEPALAFLEDVRFCFDRLASSSEQLATRSEKRSIRINATPSFVMRWLIPRSSVFQIAHPDIKFDISTSYSDEYSHLSEPHDVIFRRDTMSRPGYICTRILDDRSTPVMSPSYFERNRPEAPSDIAKLSLLHMRSRPDAWRRWLTANKVNRDETIAGPYFDHFFLSLQAAINGLGVAMGSKVLVEEDVEHGRLILPFPELTIAGPGFFAMYRASLHKEALGKEFLAWLSEETGTDL